jgi:hypothetical protein
VSRQIDLSKSLSEEEVQYLVDRERWDDLAENSEATGAEHPTRTSDPVSPQSDSARLGDKAITQVPDGANPAPASLGQRQALEGALQVTFETEDHAYEDWSKDDLKDQAERRGLSKSGNKQELADSIREWDGANRPGAGSDAEPSPDNPDDAYDGTGSDDGDPDADQPDE